MELRELMELREPYGQLLTLCVIPFVSIAHLAEGWEQVCVCSDSVNDPLRHGADLNSRQVARHFKAAEFNRKVSRARD